MAIKEDTFTFIFLKVELVTWTIVGRCRNMSGHALVGCPAARLETMVLVIISYVLVCIVGKKTMNFSVWVQFLN